MKTTQYGWIPFIMLLPIMISFHHTIPSFLIVILLAIFIIVLLIFSKLTITVDDQFVGFSFGIGIFGRKYKLSDIESCRPVKNPIWYGIGIRIIPRGMLYNVSGYMAIEFSFKNKKRVVRIGTDNPEELANYINHLLKQHTQIYIL